MGYLYDPLKETFVSDTAATDLEKDVPVRKPNAVPPKTKTIKKFLSSFMQKNIQAL